MSDEHVIVLVPPSSTPFNLAVSQASVIVSTHARPRKATKTTRTYICNGKKDRNLIQVRLRSLLHHVNLIYMVTRAWS